MTRLLLTGAGGFLAGHHFLEHVLATTDWDVVATDSFRHRGTTDRITQVLCGPASRPIRAFDTPWCDRTLVLTHDLTAPFSGQATARIGGEGGLDFLIAMASQSHVDRSITDPVEFCENNFAVALNTLELARQLRPKAVVMISTDEVYGPCAPGYGHREWAPILPSSPYAASKAAQEAVAISYWRTYGVPLIITNAVNLVGERQDPEKFIPRTLRAVLAGTEAVIHGSAGDMGSRYYLHARNMADAVVFLLRQGDPVPFAAHARPGQESSLEPDRYNVASADRLDNLELAMQIAEVAGMPLRYRLEDFRSARPGHDPHYGLNPGKIAALGWKPPVRFRDSLEHTIRWSMAHREWLAG